VQRVPKGPLVADIAVITDDWTHPLLEVEPAAGKPAVTLMPGLLLEQLPHAEAEIYIDACQERGLNHDGGTRHFGQLYSFARLRAPEEALYTFDSDQMVETAIQLSRLIVLNSHCTEWGCPSPAQLPPRGRAAATRPRALQPTLLRIPRDHRRA
jgi:hypothetical protein